jgi:hypothetical protein
VAQEGRLSHKQQEPKKNIRVSATSHCMWPIHPSSFKLISSSSDALEAAHPRRWKQLRNGLIPRKRKKKYKYLKYFLD